LFHVFFGGNAFGSCISLKNVVVPNSVTKIGDSAFYTYMRLENVFITDSVTECYYPLNLLVYILKISDKRSY